MRLQLKLLAAASVILNLLLAVPAFADEASGTWSGNVEGVGNYYWERSTRVVVPTFAAKIVAPNGVGVSANYLVDVISSASIAQTGGGEDAVFTELRHGIGVGVDNEFELGETPLDLEVHGSYSTEDDYRSINYGIGGALSLNERTSTLRLALDRVDDEIESNVPNSNLEQRCPEDSPEAGVCGLQGISVGTGWEQILSRVLVFTANYKLGYLNGFMANAYRNAGPRAEAHPHERWRHTADLRLRWLIPASDTAIHFMPRGYVDSWDIRAVNPEIRVYQELGTPEVVLRLRYRFYLQSAAEFFRPGATYPVGFMGPVTADPKMSDFQTHYAGIKFDFQMRFLEDSFLGFASPGWLFINFDRIWNTNAYGNGVIGQVGGILPF